MKTGLSTNEKLFTVLTLVVIAAFFTIFKKLNFKAGSANGSSQFGIVEPINYDMARPEQGYSGYSLEGREIDSEFELVKAKAKKAAEIAKLKTAAAKTKKDVKKQGPLPVAKAAAKTAQSNKDRALAAAASASGNSQIKTSAEKSSSGAENFSTNYGNQQAAAVAAPVDAATTSDDKTKTSKSYAQWRTEIFAKPTKETMAAFIAAFRKGDVTETEYQAMAQDLIDQSDATLKGLGLMALRSQPSLASLSQMVHVESTLSADLQAYIEAGYLTYFQSQNVQYLNAAIKTSDKTLVTKTLSLLSTNLQKIKSGDVTGFVSSRNVRDAASVNVSMSNFRVLLTALATLTSAQSDLSGTAQQIANLIQANSAAVASN